MSYRTRDAQSVEAAASALLKALAVTLNTSDIERTFTRMDADAMVKGHAWRAIKHVLGNRSLVAWQRKANRTAAVEMLLRAAAFALLPRSANPGVLARIERAEHWIIAAKLKSISSKVDAYIAGRLAGTQHDDLCRYNLVSE